MTLKEKTIQGTKWTAIEQVANQVLSFLVFLLLARLVAPEAFGLVALATAFIAFMGPLANQGMDTAIIQQPNLEPEHLDTAFWTNLVGATVLTTIGVASAELLGRLFGDPRLSPVLVALSWTFFLLSSSSVPQALLQRDLNFKALAIRSLAGTCSGAVVGIAMALAGFGVWSLVGKQLASSLMRAVLLWRLTDWRPRRRFSLPHLRQLLGFGVNVVGVQLLISVNRRTDNLVIGYFLGPLALGYYTVAYRLLTLSSQLVAGTVYGAVMPAFSRLQKDRDRLREAFYRVTNVSSVFILPVFLGVWSLSHEVVVGLFGEKWAPSVPVLEVLVFVGILQSLLRGHASLVVAAGRPGWRLAVQAVDGVLNLIGFLIAVRWGILGVAVSYVVVSYLVTPMWFMMVNKLIGIGWITYIRQIGVAAIASTAMVVSIGLLRSVVGGEHALVGLAAYTLVGAIVYIVTAAAIAPVLTRQIVDIAKTMLPSRGRA